jgi:hypothetical protein
VGEGQLEVGSPVEVRWRAIIRIDFSDLNAVWDEVTELLRIPCTYDCAARVIYGTADLRTYQQMPEYRNHPDTFLFAGISIKLDK